MASAVSARTKRGQPEEGEGGASSTKRPRVSSAATTKSVFDARFVGLNALVGGRMAYDVVTRVSVSYRDLENVLTALDAMGLARADMWFVKDYAHPCNELVPDEDADKPNKFCGARGQFVTRNGRFVCKEHVPPTVLPDGRPNPLGKHVSAVNEVHLFSGIIIMGVSGTQDRAVRAHLQGTVTFSDDDATAAQNCAFAVSAALKQMQFTWAETAADGCRTMNLEIGRREGDANLRVFFLPRERAKKTTKLSGMRVVEQNMLFFPTETPEPSQMTIVSQVSLLVSAHAFKSFPQLFSKVGGDTVRLTVERVTPTKEGILPPHSELCTLTLQSHDSELTNGVSQGTQVLFSVLKRFQTKPQTESASICAIGAAAQTAITRVQDVAMETSQVQRLLRKHASHVKGSSVMCTDYPRELLRQLFAWVVKNTWVSTVKLFTTCKAGPLVMVLHLPGDGILCVAVAPLVSEDGS